jgi:hypothetical protein
MLMTSKAQPAGSAGQRNLGTNVPSSGLAHIDRIVQRFNALNAQIVHGLPDMARACDVLERHLPLLREMQSLLSQRPMQGQRHGCGDFTMLFRMARKKAVRVAMVLRTREQLPTWSFWIKQYAEAIDYSVRHIRRKMANEPRTKTVKECGWSIAQHNSLLRAAYLSFELTKAIEAGADTVALTREIHKIMDGIPEDWFINGYEPVRVLRRTRPAKPTTYVEL